MVREINKRCGKCPQEAGSRNEEKEHDFDSKKVSEKWYVPKGLSSKGITEDGSCKMPTSEGLATHRRPCLIRQTAQDSRGQDRLNPGMAVGEEGLPSRKTTKTTRI